MNEKNYSTETAAAIRAFLKEDDWNFLFDKEKGRFGFGLRIGSPLKNIDYIIDVCDDKYIVNATTSVFANTEDPMMMSGMAEFVCRANYSLPYGSFDFDMRDGEISFKCFVDCAGIVPTEDMIRNSIYCPAAMFRLYGPGFVDILSGEVSAKEAVERCEAQIGDDEDEDEEMRELPDEQEDGEDDENFDRLFSRLAGLLDLPDGCES